jgi:hypothetical protein
LAPRHEFGHAGGRRSSLLNVEIVRDYFGGLGGATSAWTPFVPELVLSGSGAEEGEVIEPKELFRPMNPVVPDVLTLRPNKWMISRYHTKQQQN